MFRIKESYRIRHKILTTLFIEAEKENNPQIPSKRISSVEISKKTKIPIEKIDIYHELLHEEKELDCYFDCNLSNVHYMFLTSKGRQSYIDKKFIQEGRKVYWDSIYDPLKIILPIISISIAIFALYLNSSSTKAIKDNEKNIQQLNKKINQLEFRLIDNSLKSK